jgi:hypothetical protein
MYDERPGVVLPGFSFCMIWSQLVAQEKKETRAETQAQRVQAFRSAQTSEE